MLLRLPCKPRLVFQVQSPGVLCLSTLQRLQTLFINDRRMCHVCSVHCAAGHHHHHPGIREHLPVCWSAGIFKDAASNLLNMRNLCACSLLWFQMYRQLVGSGLVLSLKNDFESKPALGLICLKYLKPIA